MDSIGPNIRRLRKEAGWPEYLDAYNATGISPHTWQNLETRKFGPRGPGVGTLDQIRAALSQALGRPVSLDELVSAHGSAAISELTDRGTAVSRRRRSGNRRSNESRPENGQP